MTCTWRRYEDVPFLCSLLLSLITATCTIVALAEGPKGAWIGASEMEPWDCLCLLTSLFPVCPLNMEGEKQISGTCFIWELFSLHDVITFQRPHVLIFMLIIKCQYRDFGEHKQEKVSWLCTYVFKLSYILLSPLFPQNKKGKLL